MRILSPNRPLAIALTAGLALAFGARAGTVVQNFSQTFDLAASPTGALPQINTTWNVNQWNGPLGVLTQVQYSLNTQVYYRGVLIAVGTSKAYNLQVRSDFNFNLPGSTADVTTLDPTVSLSGTSPGTTLTTFNAPASYPTPASASSSTTVLANDFSTYVGSGVVQVVTTGSLLTTSSGGTYHNNSDIGLATPYVFVDNAKVFPMYGLQEFSLVATMTVTYTVPEPGTYAAVGFIALIAGRQWIRRNRAA